MIKRVENLSFRKITDPGLATDLAFIHNGAFQMSRRLIFPTDFFRVNEALYEDELLNPDTFIYGAFDNEAEDLLVGFSFFKFSPAPVLSGDLTLVSIREEYRGQGIGSVLVGQTLAEIHKLSPSIRIEVTCKKKLSRFYKQFGFMRDRTYRLPQIPGCGFEDRNIKMILKKNSI